MLNWMIIIAIVLLVWFFIKAKHFKHKVYVLVLMFLIIFFYATSVKVIESSGVDIKTLEGMVVVGKLYFKWLGNALDNTKTIVGEIIKMDWTGDVIKGK